MRVSSIKFRIIIVSVLLASCQNVEIDKFDILTSVKSSSFIKTQTSQIDCEVSQNFPSIKFERLCIKFKPQIIEDEATASQQGLEIGENIGAIFKEAGWTLKISEADGVYYEKMDEQSCILKVFADIGNVDDWQNGSIGAQDYPVSFSPTISFSKRRKVDCKK